MRRTVAEAVPEQHFITELRPDLEEAVDRLMERLELGERKGLAGEFQALLEKHPHNHSTNYAMGVYVAMVQENPTGAIPFFEKAVRIFPPLAEGHFNLGNCYVKTVRIAEAVAAYRQAIRYSGRGGSVAGLAQKELLRLEKITRDTSPFQTLDGFIENQKLFDHAYERLCARDYEKAIGLFHRVLEKNPKHVQSYGNMALAEAGLGHRSVALECLDKALAIDPSYAPARMNRDVLEAMKEGEPHIPPIFAETEYYRDRLEAEKSHKGSWWQKVKMWETR